MTAFKDLKQGFPIYILDTKNISVTQGRVTVPPTKPYFSANGAFNADMMVDVTVSVGGKTKTYTLNGDTEAGYDNSNSSIISTGKDLIVREIESLKSASKAIVAKCSAVLSDFDPTQKDRNEMDDRLTRLENMLSQIINQRKQNETNK